MKTMFHKTKPLMELMVRIKHFTETEQTPVAQKYMIALFAVSEHT